MRGIVGVFMDVHGDVVGLSVWAVFFGMQIECYIKEVDSGEVCIEGDLQAQLFFEHFEDVLFKLLQFRFGCPFDINTPTIPLMCQNNFKYQSRKDSIRKQRVDLCLLIFHSFTFKYFMMKIHIFQIK